VVPGLVADLVLFDPATFTDRSTDERTTELATGVEAVLLGGAFAIDGGRVTDAHRGRVVHRPAPQSLRTSAG